MQHWKTYFTPQMLQRGKAYYEEDAVYNLHQTKDGYTAKVQGSWDYTVKIKHSNNKIKDMRCTCPYALDGNYCKHMVAVFYKIEEEKNNISSSKQNKETQNQKQIQQQLLTNTINKMSETELRKFLLELVQEDISLANRVLSEYSDICTEEHISSFKIEVDNICEKYTNRHGFIQYPELEDFIEEMETFLYEKTDILLDKGLVMQAFEVTNYIFTSVANQDMDDSYCDSNVIAEHCSAVWQDILELANEQEEEEMFQWFKEHRKEGSFNGMDYYLESFLMNNFQDEEMLQDKLKELDAEIEKMITPNKNLKASYYEHQLESVMRKRIELMKELECSSKELNDYYAKYKNFSFIRQIQIKQYMEENAYDKAIKLLQESKKTDKKHLGLVSSYSQQLIELYEKTGDMENYKKELEYQIFSDYQRNLENIKRLKNIVSEQEWEKWKQKILKSGQTSSIKYEFMEWEGMYEELLNEIVKSGSVYLVSQYEKTLKKKYPEQLCEVYIAYAKSQSKRVATRKEYQELVQYLKKIATYPKGKEKAQALADEWKQAYAKRPAMMDEIKKAGF